MNDTVSENATPSTAPVLVPGSVGSLLAEARQQAGMSIEDAASSLRLSVRQVQALEADDASVLPSPAFVRGFIRNYAKLLKLDAEALLEVYQVYAPESGQKAISLHSENIPILAHDKRGWLPYVVASALVAAALGGWMLYMEHPLATNPQPVVQEEAEVLVAATEPAAVVPMAVPETFVAPAGLSAVVETPQPEPAVTAASPVANAAAMAKLTMTFRASSWVSVNDRDGREIFNRNQLAGSQAMVEGAPPFALVVGNAGGVQLTFNGKPVDLTMHTRANVARITLE